MNTTYYHRKTGQKAVVVSSSIRGVGRTLVITKQGETFTTVISQSNFFKEYAAKPPEGITYNELNKDV